MNVPPAGPKASVVLSGAAATSAATTARGAASRLRLHQGDELAPSVEAAPTRSAGIGPASMVPASYSTVQSPGDYAGVSSMMQHLDRALKTLEGKARYDWGEDLGLDPALVQQLVKRTRGKPGGAARALEEALPGRYHLSRLEASALKDELARALFESTWLRNSVLVGRGTYLRQNFEALLARHLAGELGPAGVANANQVREYLKGMLGVGLEGRTTEELISKAGKRAHAAWSRTGQEKPQWVTAEHLDHLPPGRFRDLSRQALRLTLERRTPDGAPGSLIDYPVKAPPYRGRMHSTQLAIPMHPDALRRFLPKGLGLEVDSQFGRTFLMASINHYPPGWNPMSYTHLALSIPVRRANGEKGVAAVALLEDSESARDAGAIHYADPKFLSTVGYGSDPWVGEKGDNVVASFHNPNGEPEFTVTAKPKFGIPSLVASFQYGAARSLTRDFSRFYTQGQGGGGLVHRDFWGNLAGEAHSEFVPLQVTSLSAPILKRMGLTSRDEVWAEFANVSRLNGGMSGPTVESGTVLRPPTRAG